MSFNITSFMFFIVSLSLVFGLNQLGFVAVPFAVVFIAGIIVFLVCWKFNKSRSGFIALMMVLVFFNTLNITFFSVYPTLFMLIISVNVFLLSIFRERGVFSVYGLKKTGFFLIQLFVLYIAVFIFPKLKISSDLLIVTTLILLGAATVKAVFSDKDPSLCAALGAVIAMSVTAGINTGINGMQSIAALAVMLAGVIFSVYSVSYIDELTSLPGRRAYNEYCAQLGSVYTMAMTDIDHFKSFNDTYGHDTGDDVLKLVAKIISTVGGGGKAFRFGGEEFVIVFDGIMKEQAVEFLEEIRRELETTPFTVRNKENRSKYEKTGKKTKSEPSKSVNVTMSIGAADSKKDPDPVKVLKKADTALYKAKNSGRNRVLV